MKEINTPIKITPELAMIIEETEIRRQHINETSTLELVGEKDNNIRMNIVEIVRKYGNNLSSAILSDNELDIVKNYLKILKSIFCQNVSMCKIIPQNEIKKILSLEKELIGFFSRKADIDCLLKEQNDFFETLYKGLRLDYNGSKFNLTDKYMGMLIVTMPEFSLRTPIKYELLYSESSIRKIYINREPPYSGIGFISNEWCIPEFFISISNKSDSEKENYGSFPQEAFPASFKIISHNNSIINLASYYPGDFECAADDKFVVYNKYVDFARDNGWI